MTKIIVSRSKEYINGFRDISLFIDGKKIGSIANGATAEFEVPKGEHFIKAKIDWCGSNSYKFYLAENDTQKFLLQGFKYSKRLPYIAFAIILADILIRKLYGIEFVIYLALIPFIPFLYYGLIKRDRYLQIKINK